MKAYRWMLKYKKNKRGFTLIEIIVVLVILGILAAIAVPAIFGYIEDAREAEDYAKLGVLNRSTSAYRVYLYEENRIQVDAFEGIMDDKARQEKLMEYNLLDELLVSRKNDYFYWNVTSQIWELKDSSSSGGGSEVTLDGTIMDQGAGLTDLAVFSKDKYYKYGDYFEIDGVRYKCVDPSGDVHGSDYNNLPFKKIDINYDKFNIYETGDIVMYPNGKYYKAIRKLDSVYSYQYWTLNPDNLNTQNWKEVVKDSNGNWIEQ